MFTPSDSTLLWTSEIEKNIRKPISYELDENEEFVSSSYSVSENWDTKRLNVILSQTDLVVSAPTLEGLFKPIEIQAKRMQTDEIMVYSDWDELPDGLEIIKFVPETATKTFSITFTVNVLVYPPVSATESIGYGSSETSSPPVEETREATYQIKIEPNFDLGKDRILNYASYSKTR